MKVPGRLRLPDFQVARPERAEAMMAKQAKKRVEFKRVTIVPGEVLGEDKDQEMAVGKVIALPADYADHVVSLHLAVIPAKKARSGKAKQDPQPPADPGADAGTQDPDAEDPDAGQSSDAAQSEPVHEVVAGFEGG